MGDGEMTDAEMTDAELAKQPVGYWTGLAQRAVIGFIRAEQAKLGLTQPQYWILRYLSPADLATHGEDERGLTVGELEQAMRAFIGELDDLRTDSADLVERGWLTRDEGGRLRITEAGEAGRLRVKAEVPRMVARIHEGVDDADYVTTLKVLRRMMRNVGAEV